MSRGSLDFESVNGGSIPPPGAKSYKAFKKVIIDSNPARNDSQKPGTAVRPRLRTFGTGKEFPKDRVREVLTVFQS
jgi:hypothetical protein